MCYRHSSSAQGRARGFATSRAGAPHSQQMPRGHPYPRQSLIPPFLLQKPDSPAPVPHSSITKRDLGQGTITPVPRSQQQNMSES